MQPRVNVITLGVSELEESIAFYRDGLGWQTNGIVGTEFEGGAVAFFPLENGIQLALYPKAQIADDANVDGRASSAAEFTLGHNVASKETVDTVIATAADAGADVVDQPRERVWGGYAGHFLDPDDHLWEVVWNPEFDLDET